MIILTKEQADAVRGVSAPGHELDPIPLEDGTFILPDAVLDSPVHAKHRALLAPLEKRAVSSAEFKQEAADAGELDSRK